MSQTYDLIVLGGGPAGTAAAVRAAQLKARVAVVDTGTWGGLCLHRGCVPTKLICTTMDRILEARLASQRGCRMGEVGLDAAELWNQKNQLVEFLALGSKGLIASNKVDIFQTTGKLDGPGKVLAGKDRLSAKSIIVATGSQWVRPAFPGGDLPQVINSTQFLENEQIPGKTLILGSSAWALELAQFLVTAGGEVVVAERGRDILPGIDQEISSRLRAIINEPPMTVLNRCQVISAASLQSGLKVTLQVAGEEQTDTFDKVIYFDREPGLEGLGLDTVGLEDLSVDGRLATKAEGIWAVGDAAADGPALSHRASVLGIVAAENALGGSRVFNPNAVPKVAYTRPQLACVGLSEDEAEDMGYDVITGEVSMGVNARAYIHGQTKGMVKVVADEDLHRLLGMHVLAPNATEIIGMGALAIQMEATLEDLARMFLPHPTISESLADAAREALGWAIYIPK